MEIITLRNVRLRKQQDDNEQIIVHVAFNSCFILIN